MTKLGMIGPCGFTFSYDLDNIRRINFMTAEEYYADYEVNDMYANGYNPATVLIVITFNDHTDCTFNSKKYTIYFE